MADIDVSHNKIQSQGCSAFCRVLNENSTVKKLNLAWNELKNRDAVLLSETMKLNHTLIKLDLRGNGFEEEAGMHFGKTFIIHLFWKIWVDLSCSVFPIRHFYRPFRL